MAGFFNTEDHLELSRKLLYMAFAIEVGVALLAIYLGMMSVQTGSSDLQLNIFNQTLSPILFTVVAIIELTRVPIFISIYRSNSIRWKFFGSIFLITIMYIAFETLLTAFTMNGAMQSGNIDKTIIEKRALSEENIILSNQIKDLSTLTQEKINSEYDEALNIINKEEDKEIKNVNDSINEIELIIARSSIDSISSKEKSLREKITKLDTDKKNEIDLLNKNYKKKEDLISSKIVDIENRNKLLRRNIEEKKYGFLSNQKNIDIQEVKSNEEELNKLNKNLLRNEDRLQGDINLIISKYKNEENLINNKLSELEDVKIQNESSVKNQYSSDLNKLRDDKSLIYNKYSERKKEVLIKKKEKEIKLANSEKDLEIKKAEKLEVEKEIADKRDKINQETRTNVNYIVATSVGPNLPFFPACKGVEESSDVSRTCYRNVTFLFWGSISVVVAITGTVVAMASEILRSSTFDKRSLPRGRRSLRYFIVNAYKYLRKPKIIIKEVEKIVEKPVEIVKEVPVQKVEFTEVPKIQEIIKKEIVHVPIYTNDETLINIKKDRKSKKTIDE